MTQDGRSTAPDALEVQLAELIGERGRALANVIGPPELVLELDRRALQVAANLAPQLRSGDPKEVAQLVIDLGNLIWPNSEPPPEWWGTPLGRIFASSMDLDDPPGSSDNRSVTYREAARILGVHEGTVSQWAHRGTIERHPDGGLALTSVLRRLGRRSEPG